jgi:hypothetical protein
LSGTFPDRLLDLLAPLTRADANIAATWRPHDPRTLADLHRQTMMHLSWAYFALFHATPEHPDWAPLWNPVYTCQPNPDDIYLYTPIRGDLAYRVSGDRGTCSKLIFVTQKGFTGLVDGIADMGSFATLDEPDYAVGADGRFEILFSAERPAGHTGTGAGSRPTPTRSTSATG